MIETTSPFLIKKVLCSSYKLKLKVIFANIIFSELINEKRFTVTSALPYANGPLHIGHLAGAYYLLTFLCGIKKIKEMT